LCVNGQPMLIGLFAKNGFFGIECLCPNFNFWTHHLPVADLPNWGLNVWPMNCQN